KALVCIWARTDGSRYIARLVFCHYSARIYVIYRAKTTYIAQTDRYKIFFGYWDFQLYFFNFCTFNALGFSTMTIGNRFDYPGPSVVTGSSFFLFEAPVRTPKITGIPDTLS